MRLQTAVAIALILLAGLFLRFWNLGEESIWIDEAHTMWVAQESFLGIIDEIGRDNHPPFYFFLAKANVALFGDSERALRFPSVLFALAAMFMIWLIAKRLYDPATGVVTSLLIAISPFHIHYAQEARTYTLLLLLVALSYYFLLNLSRRFTKGSIAGYVICTAILLYTHFFGVIHLAAQNLVFLAGAAAGVPSYRRNLGWWILVQAGIVVLFTPWLGFMIPVVNARLAGENTVIPAPGLKKLVGPFITYSGSRIALFPFGILALFASLPLVRAIREGNWRDLFIPLGDCLPKEDHFREGRVPFLLVWLVFPIVVPIVLSQFVSPFFVTRYTIGGATAFYILVAAGITSIPNRWARWGALLLVVALGLTGTWRYHHTDNKEAWREVAAYVDENAEPGDLILFSAGYVQHAYNYYSTRPEVARRSFPPEHAREGSTSVEDVDAEVEGFDRVWLIQAYGTDVVRLVPERLSRQYRSISVEEYARTSYAIGKSVTIRVHLFEAGEGG